MNLRLNNRTSAMESEISSISAAACADHSENIDKPVCIIILGMAGSGKTTFVQVNITVTDANFYCVTCSANRTQAQETSS